MAKGILSMNDINWQEIFGRVKEQPPEVKVEGTCCGCGHALEDHIKGICIAFLLHNVEDCGCVGQYLKEDR